MQGSYDYLIVIFALSIASLIATGIWCLVQNRKINRLYEEKNGRLQERE